MVPAMRLALALAALSSPFALVAEAGTISFSTEIPYPTRYEAHRSARDPRLVVAVPSEFSNRRTGVSLGAPQVGVVQRITFLPGRPETVDLQLADGRAVTARSGGTVSLDGRALMVLGWRQGDFLLHDPARRETLRFVRR
jgi:hypothetical protein